MITTPAKKTEHHFKLLSFPVGGSLQRAEMGHFRKAPKVLRVGKVQTQNGKHQKLANYQTIVSDHDAAALTRKFSVRTEIPVATRKNGKSAFAAFQLPFCLVEEALVEHVRVLPSVFQVPGKWGTRKRDGHGPETGFREIGSPFPRGPGSFRVVDNLFLV